jgi:hypothetical protein
VRLRLQVLHHLQECHAGAIHVADSHQQLAYLDNAFGRGIGLRGGRGGV